MSGSEFFDGVLIRSPWRSSGLVCHFLYRAYGFNTKPQQSFFFHQGKNADLSIKVKEVIMMFISYQQEQLKSLEVTHLSLRTTFAELPIGKFSSYTLVSLWSGISSTNKRTGL